MPLLLYIPICVFITTGLSCLFYILQHRTRFARLHKSLQNMIIGVSFGLAAIFATEFGISTNEAIINVRDAAPICAGLVCGGPAGVIAGIIGGAERWFSTLWGAGEFTRLACSISCVLAGLLSAVARRKLLGSQRAPFGFGIATGVVMEVLHLTLILLTHMDSPSECFPILKLCTIPMVIGTTAAVAVPLACLKRVSNDIHQDAYMPHALTRRLQAWLLVCIAFGLVLTTLFTFNLQTEVARNSATQLLKLNLDDVTLDVDDSFCDSIGELSKNIRRQLRSGTITLAEVPLAYDINRINIVDENGIIIESGVSDPGMVGQLGFYYSTYEEAEDTSSTNQTVFDEEAEMQYVMSPLDKTAGTYIEYSMTLSQVQNRLAEEMADFCINRRVGKTGYILVADADLNLVSQKPDQSLTTLREAGLDFSDWVLPKGRFTATLYGVDCLCMCSDIYNYIVIAAIPYDEIYSSRDNVLYMNAFLQVLMFALMFIMLFLLLKHMVVNKLLLINQSLKKITDGDLDTRVEEYSAKEFMLLSDGINTTVDALKASIAKAAARLDDELALARQIQNSALPNVFPAFPNVPSFDLFAGMQTAKVVGGDFYDFYMPDSDHLAFVVADVSGKGIPAALFMMSSKVILRSLTESGLELSEVFCRTNEQLCAGNDANMFVTAWMGILELSTGHLTFVNAGHNPPLLYRPAEGWSYLRTRPGMVLAGLAESVYKPQELVLQAGDRLFLYTDGATEAINAHSEQYGEERLKAVLDSVSHVGSEAIVRAVQTNIATFVGETDRFDDITLLSLHYLGAAAKPE